MMSPPLDRRHRKGLLRFGRGVQVIEVDPDSEYGEHRDNAPKSEHAVRQTQRQLGRVAAGRLANRRYSL